MKVRLKFLLPMVVVVGLLTTAFVGSNGGRYFEIAKNLEIFSNLYKEVNANYVDELEPGKLMRVGIDAMLKSLDPYTNYIAESDIEGYRFYNDGSYHGIGAIYKNIGDYITITDIYESSPASKSGLKVGDVVIAIDGKSTKGKNFDAIESILKGSAGSLINVTVQRAGKEQNISMKREEVDIKNVPHYSMVSPEVGYIVLSTFTQNAGENIANAINDLKKNNPGMKSIILDLRGNGGGLLNEAIRICNLFTPKDVPIVTTKGKIQEQDITYKTMASPLDEKIPIAILIDKNSASASEIVSGTIQDLDRGVIIGQQSYGKGLVQNTKDIGYNAKVKITTSRYYIPSGRCIQAVNYKDGEPVHVPDNQRAVFKTANGRKVLDGGGVKPDIVMEKQKQSALIKTLIDENYIFDFVTEYCSNKTQIDSADKFHFMDWDKFTTFLDKRKFEYQTESEKALTKLKEEATKENRGLDADLKLIESKLKADKKMAVQNSKNQIVDLIEQEIIGRYYYHKGKIIIGLRNDKEIVEAISILNDPKRYNKILNK